MPESEPKPRLIELVAPGAGQGWKAVLKNGKPAVVHEIPVPPAEAAAAIPRLQRLADHRHPALSPVLAWGTDPNGVWVAVEPNEGTPLSTLLSRGPLTPPAAASLGAAVLSGVAALHEAGIAMGGFGATAIRVTGNGEVRLAGHPAAAVRGAPAQSDLRADVRSCGMAVCAAFGVDPAGAPAPPNVPPGLVVTMRSMASGAMGPAADRAQGALREMAAALLAPDRMVAAQAELATRAGGREMPGVTPFLPQGAAQAAPPPPAPTPTVPPAPRDETPIRAPVSYDAPPRPMQTYPGIPAPIFTPPGPPAAPVPPPGPPELRQSPVPTWSDAPARPPAPYEAPAAPVAMTPPAPLPTTTNPPAPAPEVISPAPTPFTPAGTRLPFETAVPSPATSTNPPASAPPAPPAPTPFTPAGTRSPFETAVPSPATSTNPPASAPPAFPAPPAASQSTWTPVEHPTWTPGKVEAPAEPAPWVPGAAGAAAAAAAAAGAGAASVTPTPAPSPTYAPAPAPLFVPTPAPTPARMPTVARRPAGRGSSERPTWLIPAIIAVVLILLLGIGGVVIASRSGSSKGTASTSPTAKTSPKASPQTSPKASPGTTPAPKGPLAVPNFGPAAAAPITSVIICSTATPCKISGSPPEIATACDLSACHVEVGIYFSSAQKVPVSYVLKFFDRCTGTTTDLPGPNAYTPPAYLIVIPVEKWPVTLPSGVKSGALVAVAQQPAVAASAPLMLGGDSCA